MIYSWEVVMDCGLTKHVVAEEALITDGGLLVFYVGDKIVSAFWDYSSVQRLPSE